MSYSAAEIERFTYCPLSWSLAQRGQDGVGEATAQGERAHAAIGTRISIWRSLLDEHYSALRIALYLALAAASAATLALEVVFLDANGPSHWILLAMSLTWLLVSLGFLLRAIWKEDEAKQVVAESGLVQGELAYSDLDRPAETLRAPRYDLSGRPDYIVRRGEAYIPVEVKTGRTPDKPHDSHLMQLGVYCILVEEKYGKRPTHGVLQYAQCSFEVPFTEAFRDKVLQTTLKMRLAEMTGNVHRIHNSPGKCRGCSRRDACTERLA
ncbi:MAG: CRISPR-associated protein Cas4 [Candidatus Thermoplasmatota archaeon]